MRFNARFLALAFCLFALAMTSPPSAAQNLYGIDTVHSQLITIDSSTGAGSVVGPLGLYVGSSGADFAAGQLYALMSELFTNDNKLFTIDTATGAATAVVTADSMIGYRGIEFSEDNSTVYYTSDDEFWELDPGTGACTFVGMMPQDASQLARDGDGVYYTFQKGDLYTVDPNSAATSFVGATGLGGPLAWNPVDGQLYAVSGMNLYSIDPTDGTPTLIGPVGYQVSGLAFDYGPVPAEKNSWGRMKSHYRK